MWESLHLATLWASTACTGKLLLLEYAIRKVEENQEGLKLNGTHKLPIYADIVNVLGVNIDTIKKNTQTLIDASKEVGL
jgi:hypothetical protein